MCISTTDVMLQQAHTTIHYSCVHTYNMKSLHCLHRYGNRRALIDTNQEPISYHLIWQFYHLWQPSTVSVILVAIARVCWTVKLLLMLLSKLPGCLLFTSVYAIVWYYTLSLMQHMLIRHPTLGVILRHWKYETLHGPAIKKINEVIVN